MIHHTRCPSSIWRDNCHFLAQAQLFLGLHCFGCPGGSALATNSCFVFGQRICSKTKKWTDFECSRNVIKSIWSNLNLAHHFAIEHVTSNGVKRPGASGASKGVTPKQRCEPSSGDQGTAEMGQNPMEISRILSIMDIFILLVVLWSYASLMPIFFWYRELWSKWRLGMTI